MTELARLVREAVEAHAPDVVEPGPLLERVRRRADLGRRRRRRALNLCAAGVAFAVGAGAVWSLVRPAPPVQPSVSSLDARTYCPRAPLPQEPRVVPTTFRPVMVVGCGVQLVDRGSEGAWLQATERHAVAGIDSYLAALRLPQGTGGSCPRGRYEPPRAVLLVDAQGATFLAQLPGTCGPLTEATAAERHLTWEVRGQRWIRRVGTPNLARGVCWPEWVRAYALDGLEYSDEQPYPPRGLLRGTILLRSDGDTRCMVLLDGRITLVEASFVSGPRRIVAAVASAPPIEGGSKACLQQVPPRVFAVRVDGELAGYAALDCRVSAVGPDLLPASPVLASVVVALASPG